MAQVTTDAMRRTHPPLIQEARMRCPKCGRWFNILAFKRLEMPEGYEDDLTPVYRCPRDAHAVAPDAWVGRGGCGFIFAPADNPAPMMEVI